MKKSELRNIIRESIKQLMNEQGSWPGSPNSRVIHYSECNGSGLTISTNTAVTIDGQTPQVGDTFTFCCGGYASSQGHGMPCSYGQRRMGGCNTVLQASAAFNPNHYINQVRKVVAVAPAGQTFPNYGGNITGHMNHTSVPCGWTPPWTNPSSGCDPNAPFPPNFNLQSWTNTWTNLPNFSSSNPNQPCNFICQRRNQWTAQLAAGGMGPKQTNMVACRLEEAENQYQIHNCATSNANNCP